MRLNTATNRRNALPLGRKGLGEILFLIALPLFGVNTPCLFSMP